MLPPRSSGPPVALPVNSTVYFNTIIQYPVFNSIVYLNRIIQYPVSGLHQGGMLPPRSSGPPVALPVNSTVYFNTIIQYPVFNSIVYLNRIIQYPVSGLHQGGMLPPRSSGPPVALPVNSILYLNRIFQHPRPAHPPRTAASG
jgi:hypothetical protein